MKHESTTSILKIEETDITFDSIYEKKWFPSEIADEVKKANFLIIPNENYRDDGDVLFPETTSEFYNFVKKEASNEFIPDIAISDSDFKKIELHSALIDVATVIINSGILPITINLISSYLYDLVKKYRRNPEHTNAKVNILVEETKNKKTTRITYEGPVSGIKQTFENATTDLLKKQ